MKKTLLISFLFCLTGVVLQAQNYTGKNDQKLQAGFNFYGKGTGIKLTYDYGLNENFSIGAGGTFYNSGDYKSKFFLFGRGAYHFGKVIENLPKELDLYIGLELGLIGNGDFGFGAHIGARYKLAKSLSAFLEVGNNGALGIAIHL